MNIFIPHYTKDYNLNDYQKVFLAFLLFLERREGHSTEFIFYSSDVKRITGSEAIPRSGRNASMNELLKVININTYCSYNWGISFNQELKTTVTTGEMKGALLQQEVEITDENACRIMFYLMGKFTGGNIISDNDGSCFPHERSKSNLPRQIQKQLKYF